MEKEDNRRYRFAMKETDPHSPSPLPEPQDVRQKIADWFEDWTDGVPGCADKESNLAFADAIIRAFPALAQSDAQPPDCPTEGVAARQGNGG